MSAARNGEGGPTWFASLHQTAGRGRRGRHWHTPQGNLAASLLIVPELDHARAATLGFVAGLALRQALQELLPDHSIGVGLDGADGAGGPVPARISLKWPNDVLADGEKLAGILLEAEKLGDGRHAIVIGFGVNIVAAPEGLPYPATSLAALGYNVSAAAVFEALSDAWIDCIGIWNEGAGIPAILALWRGAASGIGAPVAVSQHGEVVRGVFETIDDSGRLIVRSGDDRRIAITAGDVHFGATASAAP